MKTNLLLEFNRVGFGYPGQALILSELDFTISIGERILILGANGSGKSTLAKLATGIIKPTSGKITRHALDEQGFEPKIGIVFQDSRSQIVGATVEEELAFGLTILQLPPKEIIAKVSIFLDQFGLTKKKFYPPYQLSGGELRRLALAAVLITEPDLLILDEPLTMLDALNREFVLNYLQNITAKAILWLDHDLKSIRYNEKWFMFNKVGNLAPLNIHEINSEKNLRTHQISPTPLQPLEWRFPARISQSIYGPEYIKFQ